MFDVQTELDVKNMPDLTIKEIADICNKERRNFTKLEI